MSQPARAFAPRIVVDVGVYVSAAISATGPPAELLAAAVEGQAVLLVSPLLLAELREVLAREKFRRWITLEDAETFIQGLELLATNVIDPPESVWPHVRPVCRDPDDDYLIALAETEQAALAGVSWLVRSWAGLADLGMAVGGCDLLIWACR
jgi:putative PIN family toxin of toxin-antitoxin system